jgi:hypothetical protein
VPSDAPLEHFRTTAVARDAEALVAALGDFRRVGHVLGFELEVDDPLDDDLALGLARRMPATGAAQSLTVDAFMLAPT